MLRWTRSTGTHLAHGLLPACLCAAVFASFAQQAPVSGIYTCTDARGRKLTADRPIPECVDREQAILNPSGTLKARIGPSLTPQERALQEAREKAALAEQARQVEEKRRDRALVTRYPNRAVHAKERAEALAKINLVRQTALNRVEELMRQRDALNAEMEFYAKDPSKAPPALQHQVEEVNQSLAVQGRFLAEQDTELRRVNARFDEELARLQQLWAMQAPAVSPLAVSKVR